LRKQRPGSHSIAINTLTSNNSFCGTDQGRTGIAAAGYCVPVLFLYYQLIKILFMKKKLISIYLEYLNDFLTVSRMAEYYGLSVEDMSTLIEMGKKYSKE